MNVNDVVISGVIKGDMLESIFEHQRALMEKYHHIEENQGVGYGILAGRVFNLNEIRSQCLLKDFAWRVTEEVMEATDSFKDGDENDTHYLEELADALHFMTELCIVAGITPDMITQDPLLQGYTGDKLKGLFLIAYTEGSRVEVAYSIIQHLGNAMNCLKQKPWKQTHILTDTKRFKQYIILAYKAIIQLWYRNDSSAESMYNYYLRKNQVNQFRQRSKY